MGGLSKRCALFNSSVDSMPFNSSHERGHDIPFLCLIQYDEKSYEKQHATFAGGYRDIQILYTLIANYSRHVSILGLGYRRDM